MAAEEFLDNGGIPYRRIVTWFSMQGSRIVLQIAQIDLDSDFKAP